MTDEAQEKKKGLHPLAKVGIGCGILIVLGIAGTVVLGVMGVSFFKKTVVEVEKTWEEAEKTRLEAEERWHASAGGSVGGLEELSGWFDLPEGLTGLRSVLHEESNGKISGRAAAESVVQPLALGDAFAEKMTAAGFAQLKKTETGEVVTYIFDQDAEQRLVNITITAGTGAASVVIDYIEE